MVHSFHGKLLSISRVSLPFPQEENIMELTEHFNAHNVSVLLPSLPDGYSWRMRLVRPLEAAGGGIALMTTLVLELRKIVPVNSLEFFFMSLWNKKAKHTKEIVLRYTSFPNDYDFSTLDAQVELERFAIRMYSKEFSTKLSDYAGTYSEKSSEQNSEG